MRTPFGLTLQGLRDDPVRMASLGYNVALHRTIAFTLAAFVASIGGVLFVWWNGHIDPASIDLTATIDVLVIAVIGGLFRIEGAWLGALFFVIINNYSQRIDFIGSRFHTLIGGDLPRDRAGLAGGPDRPLGSPARTLLAGVARAPGTGIRSTRRQAEPSV